MKKRMLSLILTLCMLLTLLPAAALGAETELTSQTVSGNFDLSVYASPANPITLTAQDGAVLSGGALTNVQIAIAAGATVILDGVKLYGCDLTLSEAPTPTISGAADATLIIKGNSDIRGVSRTALTQTSAVGGDAISGVGTVLALEGVVKGGDWVVCNTGDNNNQVPESSTGKKAGRAIVDASTVVVTGGVACGSVRLWSGTNVTDSVKAVETTGALTYYGNEGLTMSATGGITRLYRLTLENATTSTTSAVPASDLMLYEASTNVTLAAGSPGGIWVAVPSADASLVTGDTPTFAMPAHDLELSNKAALVVAGSWTDEGNYDATLYATPAGDWTISNAEDLAAFAKKVNAGADFSGFTVTLADDLNLSAHQWPAIGAGETVFSGLFDGGEHTISGLTITDDLTAIEGIGSYGLFGKTSGARIKDLTLAETVITPSLVKDANNSTTFSVGGVVGNAVESVVDNCHVSGNIVVASKKDGDTPQNIWETNVGSVVGYAYNSTMLNCSSAGTVGADGLKSSLYAGGIVGNTELDDGGGCVFNSYSRSTVVYENSEGSKQRGGIAGLVFFDNVVNNYATNSVAIGADSGTIVSHNYHPVGAVGETDSYGSSGTETSDADMKAAAGTANALVNKLNSAEAMQAVTDLLASSGVVCAHRDGLAPLAWKNGPDGYPVHKAPERITTQPTTDVLTVVATTANGTPTYQWQEQKVVNQPLLDKWAWDNATDGGAWKSQTAGQDDSQAILRGAIAADSNGKIAFDWKASSESASFDYLYYTLYSDPNYATEVPGGTESPIGGLDMTDFASVTLTGLTAGQDYYLELIYTKDYTTGEGDDCGWVKFSAQQPIKSEAWVNISGQTTATLDPTGLAKGTLVHCVVSYPWGETLTSDSAAVGENVPVPTVEATWGTSVDDLSESGTLDDALKSNAGYIQLQSAAAFSAATIARTLTLDLNGLTATGKDANSHITVATDGDMTILDGKTGGKLTTAADAMVYLSGTGKLTLKSGAVESTTGAAVHIKTDASDPSDPNDIMTHKYTLTIKGGTVHGKTYGIYHGGTNRGADIKITGGSVTAEEEQNAIYMGCKAGNCLYLADTPTVGGILLKRGYTQSATSAPVRGTTAANGGITGTYTGTPISVSLSGADWAEGDELVSSMASGKFTVTTPPTGLVTAEEDAQGGLGAPVPLKNLVLEAKAYTVTFDSQGATTAANPASKTVTGSATTVGTLPTPPTKTGYVFMGWYTETEGKGTRFKVDTNVNSDLTVYAKWTESAACVTTAAGAATEYEYFTDAVSAAKNSAGSTLKMRKNWAYLNAGLELDGTFTLDFAGKTTSLVQFQIKGTITMKDSVGGGKHTKSDNAAVWVFDGGTLLLQSGIIEGIGDKKSACGLYVDAGGTAVLSGGTVKALEGNAACPIINKGGTVKLTGSPVLNGPFEHIYVDTANSLIANVDGVPYSGAALKLDYDEEKLDVGDVLVSGLTDAAHAAKFTLKSSKPGLKAEYDDTAKSIKLAVEPPDPDAFVPSNGGVTVDSVYLRQRQPHHPHSGQG